VRAAILKNLDNGWIHAPKREDRSLLSPGQDLLALERLDAPLLPGVSLWMFSEEDGSYKVSNIVPLKTGELGISGYNAALNHFLQSVVEPACESESLKAKVSGASMSIDDWAGEPSAKALKSFAELANKSTGRSHPMDEQRWLHFLLEAHRAKSVLGGDQLARWLIEAERWPLEIAYELASEYDLSRTLLDLYDKQR
jgi:hypothetical protein